MPKVTTLIIIALYTTVAHFCLPQWNDGKDFLFLSAWNLFGGGIKTQVYDITWDQGATYLVRDHQQLMSDGQIDKIRLFSALQKNQPQLIKTFHLKQIQNLCHCNDVQLATLSGSLYEHFILKKPLPVALTTL